MALGQWQESKREQTDKQTKLMPKFLSTNLQYLYVKLFSGFKFPKHNESDYVLFL
jgi:hypothetical protein